MSNAPMEKTWSTRMREIMEALVHRHSPDTINDAEAYAIAAAAQALRRFYGDTREGRILDYHARNPKACLFRDPNTVHALKAGLVALERQERKEQEERHAGR